MVGTRRNLFNPESDSANNGNVNGNGHGNGFESYSDIENGYGSINPVHPKQRFRDAVKQTIHDCRANEMKQKLIDNVDHELLEHFRKSDESVS